jgi:hypothetical protein
MFLSLRVKKQAKTRDKLRTFPELLPSITGLLVLLLESESFAHLTQGMMREERMPF